MADTKKVLDLIKKHEAKYVDFRFTDPRGKWHHLAQHIATINEDMPDRRHHVRRLLHRRLEGDQRVRHDPAARLRHGGHGSLRRPALRRRLLRRAGAADRPELRPRSALGRQERRGLSEDHRHRRHHVCRARGRVLRLRRRPLRPADERRLLRGQLRGRPLSLGQEDGRGQPRPSPADQGRLFPGAPAGCLLRSPGRDADGDRRHGRRGGEAPSRGGAEPA